MSKAFEGIDVEEEIEDKIEGMEAEHLPRSEPLLQQKEQSIVQTVGVHKNKQNNYQSTWPFREKNVVMAVGIPGIGKSTMI